MGPKILHRPGLIRPTGSQGQSRIFEPIGSISQSIADTRNIIVVKLIKSVIANPTEGQEGLRPVRSPKSFSEAHHLQLSRSMLIRYIIVVKLIKSVIANPTVGEIKIILRDTVDRHEKDTPWKNDFSLFPRTYNEKIISIYDDRIVKRTGSENDFGLRVAQ